MSKENGFTDPDASAKEDDELINEADSQGPIDWSLVYWKPKGEGYENVVRILPGVKGASYHLKFGKHFVEHPDKTESFVCNRVTYQEKCLTCEHRDALIKEGKNKEAERFAVQAKGAFNVVTYDDEELRVRIWEAPPTAVWLYIVKMVRGKSRFNNIVGRRADKEQGIEADPLEGRDLIVFFDKDASPQNKYKLQFDSTTKIKAKSAEKWMAEAKPLIREELYPKTSDEVAKIKTFGSAQEREELRKRLSSQAQGADAPAAVTEAAKEIVEEGKEDELVDDVARAKKALAEAEAKKAEKEKEPEDEVAKAERILAEAKKKKAEAADKPAEKPKEEKKKETPEDVKAKVDEIRKKHQSE